MSSLLSRLGLSIDLTQFNEPDSPSRFFISDLAPSLAELRRKEQAFLCLFGSAAIDVSGPLVNALDSSATVNYRSMRFMVHGWIGDDRLLVLPYAGTYPKDLTVVALPDGEKIDFSIFPKRPYSTTLELPRYTDALLCGQCGALLFRVIGEDWTCKICGTEAQA